MGELSSGLSFAKYEEQARKKSEGNVRSLVPYFHFALAKCYQKQGKIAEAHRECMTLLKKYERPDEVEEVSVCSREPRSRHESKRSTRRISLARSDSRPGRVQTMVSTPIRDRSRASELNNPTIDMIESDLRQVPKIRELKELEL